MSSIKADVNYGFDAIDLKIEGVKADVNNGNKTIGLKIEDIQTNLESEIDILTAEVKNGIAELDEEIYAVHVIIMICILTLTTRRKKPVRCVCQRKSLQNAWITALPRSSVGLVCAWSARRASG